MDLLHEELKERKHWDVRYSSSSLFCLCLIPAVPLDALAFAYGFYFQSNGDNNVHKVCFFLLLSSLLHLISISIGIILWGSLHCYSPECNRLFRLYNFAREFISLFFLLWLIYGTILLQNFSQAKVFFQGGLY